MSTTKPPPAIDHEMAVALGVHVYNRTRMIHDIKMQAQLLLALRNKANNYGNPVPKLLVFVEDPSQSMSSLFKATRMKKD